MQSAKIKTGLAWFSTKASFTTHAPLIENAQVDTVQWTVDSLDFKTIPERDFLLMAEFAKKESLSGHGVNYGVLSAGGRDVRKKWIEKFRHDPLRKLYKQVSVHFGYSSGWKLKQNAPMPVPFTKEALEAGIKNLADLAEVTPCPIGLENLALAFSRKDVEDQGRFLEEFLLPFDGYLLLDLHNLYCQSINFEVELMELVKSYPLQRVREMHISGGSWSEGSSGRKIRRDTHDYGVPEELFKILPQVISICPQMQFVFLEQLASALVTEAQQQQYRSDYKRLREICVNA